jgi:ATP-dependent helicase/nuclease subunit B
LKVAKEIKENQYPDREVIPAGMTYYQMKDPLVKIDDGMITDERLEAEILKKLRPKGLILEDEQVIRMFDQNIQGASKTVPVSLTSKGISSRSSTIKAEDLDTVFDYVSHKIACISRKMIEGEVRIQPTHYEGKTPCEYCKYRSVCRFDPTINQENYRHITKMESEDILDKMRNTNTQS